jgi:hypothetical protein
VIWENNETISVSVDGLAVGTYNYTILVWSSQNDVVIDTVVVNVLASPLRTTLFVITIGSLGVVTVFTLLILKKYKLDSGEE